MHLSLRAKLFLTLLCVSLVTVVITQGFVRWSFQRGLEALAAERREQRLAAIAERLVERHRRDGGWERLAADKRLWVRTLLGAPLARHGPHWAEHGLGSNGQGAWAGDLEGDAPHGLPLERPPEHPLGRPFGRRGPPPWAQQPLREHAPDLLGEPGGWPPRRLLARIAAGAPPRALELRLMLLDADGAIIYGREDLLDAAEWRPLRDGPDTIGTLALLPGPPITELADLRFRERQSLALWLIGLGVALLAALLAFPLSQRLTRPVAAFQHTMRRLAAGDYAARVAVAGNDELGRLGRDLNDLAAALARTEQARRQWAADIAHELRTPLALLRADLEAMQDGVRPLDRAALDALHADALRLGRLIDDLYELSMTDLGALSYRKAQVDLHELLEDALDAFRGAFADAGIDLRLTTADAGADTDWTLHGDAQRLTQLVRNLLRNSLAYTDRGGALVVTLFRRGTWLCMDFDDTAPGVPAADLPRLFERLYRVDASRSRATGGAGLGLAIARNIAAAHGGEISAAASPLGGLRVHLALPGGAEGAAGTGRTGYNSGHQGPGNDSGGGR